MSKNWTTWYFEFLNHTGVAMAGREEFDPFKD
jgi:hypothetical protein